MLLCSYFEALRLIIIEQDLAIEDIYDNMKALPHYEILVSSNMSQFTTTPFKSKSRHVL